MSERKAKMRRLDEPGPSRSRRDSIVSSSPDNFMVLFMDPMIEYLLRHLPAKDLLNCCCVRKEWNEKVSQFKGIWKSLCRKYGILYTDPPGASNDHCRKFFAKFARRVGDLRMVNCYKMSTFAPFPFTSLYMITAMHCNNEYVAAINDSRIIRIFRMDEGAVSPAINTFEAFSYIHDHVSYIRIDGDRVIAATKTGQVWAWNIFNFQPVGHQDFSRTLHAFDVLEMSNLIACGFSDTVKIFNIISNDEMETKVFSGGEIVRVLLAWQETESTDFYNRSALLFVMNRTEVYVMHFSIRLLDGYRRMYIFAAEQIFNCTQFPRAEVRYEGFLRGSMCYDGNILYFTAFPSEGMGRGISRYDVTNRRFLGNSRTQRFIKAMLGVGKMHIALITGKIDKRSFILEALDKTTFESRACCPYFPYVIYPISYFNLVKIRFSG